MTDYIYAKLKQLSVAKILLDKNINEYLIPKYSKPKFDIGKMYLIKVSSEIVNNPNSILAINWNSGNSPKNTYYKAYVNKVIGGNIHCDCLAINPITKQDLSEIFSGYLDINYIEQLEVL